ncbi:hypothetical protein BKA70DRAFT_57228 [Coprinopsis sp. MPI-PUGE-AT-0042]|nr:hypothetical protein BKA70DRAFT_57228 [Coprinopsis sp. MPI-PUGE-AT-0042]
MQFLCYGSLGFNRLIPLPPTIPFQPPHLFSNLSPHRPCSSTTTHTSVFQAPNTMYGHDCQPRVLYLLKRCQNPAFSNLAQMTRTRRGLRPILRNGTVDAGFIWRNRWPPVARFGSGRRHRQAESRSAPSSSSPPPHCAESRHSLDLGRGAEPWGFPRHRCRHPRDRRFEGRMKRFRIYRASDRSTRAAWGLGIGNA